MKNLNIYHAGLYSNVECGVQRVHHLMLVFQVSGLYSLKSLTKDNFEVSYSTPYCYLYFPGDIYEFKFKEKREDWVTIFDYPGIKRISDKQFSFACGGKKIILPRYLEITQDDLLHWRNKFDRLVRMSTASTPHEQMLAKLYVLDIFSCYIETADKGGQTCPATKLKHLIDIPENMHFSIAELSAQCAYSTDHLRVLFKSKYGISPQEYRINSIMTYAMELICKSDMLVSDVAEKCGFEHLSHFSALFKKTHGMAPSKALTIFRYR